MASPGFSLGESWLQSWLILAAVVAGPSFSLGGSWLQSWLILGSVLAGPKFSLGGSWLQSRFSLGGQGAHHGECNARICDSPAAEGLFRLCGLRSFVHFRIIKLRKADEEKGAGRE